MSFCPQCGEATLPQAKFCVSCGERLSESGAKSRPSIRIGPAFIGAFGAIVAAGIVIAFLLLRQQTPAESPAPEQQQQQQQQSAASASQENLPPGHPKLELPPEAVKYLAGLQDEANKNPNNLAAWNKLGDANFRAAMFDDSYFHKSLDAYVHVLKADPDNLDALRGVGNLNYDHRKYDQAIAAYEHYLRKKSDDPEVRTDLGTMFLYTGNPDQAVVQYQKALALKPDFFEGYFNLGIAYGEENHDAEARGAFQKAMALAPDDKAKSRVNEMLAKLDGARNAVGSKASTSGTQTMQSSNPDAFENDVERVVRNLPIAGPKVKSFQWISKTNAKVLMDNFPMDQMPPFAKQKFQQDLKAGLENAKKTHNVGGSVRLDIADADSGRVMESVSE
jgi:tetratricopeptide (TPR) repeat protein